MRRSLAIAIAFLSLVPMLGIAAEPSTTPTTIPATRPELKRALEALKSREPRLPLEASFAGAAGAGLLPKTWGGGGGLGFDVRSETGLDDRLLDCCFWIVSRGNNCHYCLGHQELKLQFLGMDDDAIASLDTDWSGFSLREQAAMKFARRLTLEPFAIVDADVAALREHFSDRQIIELAFAVARFNVANRWTDGVGLPHESQFGDGRKIEFDTPTSAKFRNAKSIVVEVARVMPPVVRTWKEVERKIAACRKRVPRVELPSVSDASQALPDSIGDRSPLRWEQALAALPKNGVAFIDIWHEINSDQNLSPRLKAEIAFITAANNGAWYSAAHAAHRLKQLGVTNEELSQLLQAHGPAAGDAAAAYHLAAKSTRDPHLITDADLAAVRASFSDNETAEIMQVICMANLFDRFTESLGLPVEAGVAVD